jgi:hypothetical protein
MTVVDPVTTTLRAGTRVASEPSWERRVLQEPGQFLALLESAGAPSEFIEEAQKQLDLAHLALRSNVSSRLPSAAASVATRIKDRKALAKFRRYWKATGESEGTSQDRLVEVPVMVISTPNVDLASAKVVAKQSSTSGFGIKVEGPSVRIGGSYTVGITHSQGADVPSDSKFRFYTVLRFQETVVWRRYQGHGEAFPFSEFILNKDQDTRVFPESLTADLEHSSVPNRVKSYPLSRVQTNGIFEGSDTSDRGRTDTLEIGSSLGVVNFAIRCKIAVKDSVSLEWKLPYGINYDGYDIVGDDLRLGRIGTVLEARS